MTRVGENEAGFVGTQNGLIVEIPGIVLAFTQHVVECADGFEHDVLISVGRHAGDSQVDTHWFPGRQAIFVQNPGVFVMQVPTEHYEIVAYCGRELWLPGTRRC